MRVCGNIGGYESPTWMLMVE